MPAVAPNIFLIAAVSTASLASVAVPCRAVPCREHWCSRFRQVPWRRLRVSVASARDSPHARRG